MDLQETPVAREARRFGIPVLTPKTLRTEEAAAEFRAHKADAAVVVAYGLILPVPILEAVPLGCFNVHASLLPRWRGAAPINRAVMAGDAESGVTIMRMEEGLDTGPMAMVERVAIGADMTAGELHDALARLGADLMVRALGALERGTLAAHAAAGRRASPTRTRSTRARRASTGASRGKRCTTIAAGCRRFPARGSSLAVSASRCCARRAGEGSGAPGTVLDDRLTIACGDGAVRLTEVQRAGKQPMKAEEFLRGDEDRARNATVVNVRPERAEDAAAIREILVAAFPSAAEADLVERLRRDGDLALALVADERRHASRLRGLSEARGRRWQERIHASSGSRPSP